MGVWIEIKYIWHKIRLVCVTPFVGVWIEIYKQVNMALETYVTPFVGVWIEILAIAVDGEPLQCHSLRGSVD